MTRSQDFSVRGKYNDPRFQFDSDSNKGVSDWPDHRTSAHLNAMKIKLESGSSGDFNDRIGQELGPSNSGEHWFNSTIFSLAITAITKKSSQFSLSAWWNRKGFKFWTSNQLIIIGIISHKFELWWVIFSTSVYPIKTIIWFWSTIKLYMPENIHLPSSQIFIF